MGKRVLTSNPLSVDRSMGDVHPLGNPHYHISHWNILKAAEGMADALSKIDSINAKVYRKNLSFFKERLKEKQREWNFKALKGKRFIAYHRYFEYLAAEFGFSIIGYIEQKPGIPPSLSHVDGLIKTVRKEKPDAILFTVYGGKREVDFISQKTGVKGIVVPHDVGSHEGINDWFNLMDRILKSIE